MFYFLDGVEATPLCRSCLTRLEREKALLGTPLSALEGAAPDPTGAPATLDDALHHYLEEELHRIELTLERLPEEDPAALLARQLQRKAQQELGRSRLSEVILCLGDLRRNLADIERTLERPSAVAAAPWDESVDEMLERVNARARALTPPARRSPLDRAPSTGSARGTSPLPVEPA
jgi:phage-related minor tail protein